MLNKAILMGRLTADPELRKTPSDVSVTTFTLAVDRNYGKGNDRATDFINCVAWRQEAEFIQIVFYNSRTGALAVVQRPADGRGRLHPDPQLRGQERQQTHRRGSRCGPRPFRRGQQRLLFRQRFWPASSHDSSSRFQQCGLLRTGCQLFLRFSGRF